MPTYQYACTECGEQLEAVQKFTDDPLTVCPACQGRLRKLFSSVGVVFKGSGFYKTDSRAAAGKAAPSTSPATSSSTAGESSAAKSSGSSTDGGTSTKDSTGSSSSGSSSSGSSSSGSSSGASTGTSGDSKVA